MESQFLALIFIVTVIALFIFFLALDWYRRKEVQDLKTLEHEVVAAENDLDFREDGKFFLIRLRQRGLLPSVETKIKNVITRKHVGFYTRVFDASDLISAAGSGVRVNLIGIAVEFENAALPRFEIKPRALSDKVRIFEDKVKVKNKLLPAYLKNDFSVFHARGSSPQKVVTLLEGRTDINKFIVRKGFHRLAGSKRTLVYYRVGELKPTVEQYQQMEAYAIRLANIFNQSEILTQKDSASEEIKLLKGKS